MVAVAAIVGVVALDGLALVLGYDSWLLGLALSLVAGLGGYSARKPLDRLLRRR